MSNCGAEITKYIVVQPSGIVITGSTGDFTVNGNLFVCNSGSTIFTDTIDPCTSGVTINSNFTVYQDITQPTSDNTKSFGTPNRRFRDVNTVSGTSTVWASTDRVITPVLHLGLDSQSNNRIITANNSIIQDDLLDAGDY